MLCISWVKHVYFVGIFPTFKFEKLQNCSHLFRGKLDEADFAEEEASNEAANTRDFSKILGIPDWDLKI